MKKKTGIFLPFFAEKGGVLPNPKNPYQKKLRWSKKGEGGSQFFFTKSKKKTVFMPPLSHVSSESSESLYAV